jgi:long-chain acyl-CoA synthetase
LSAGGWLHTGDIGHLDANGYLSVVDRKKDLIIRGGYNVYPRDFEDVLASHPRSAHFRGQGGSEAAAGHTSTVSVVVTGAVPSALAVRVTVYVPGAP